MSVYLSYLMGAEEISDHDLESINVRIVDRSSDGSRKLEMSCSVVSSYIRLVREKLSDGFWNEIVGADEIRFIFKLQNGSIEEIVLSPETEQKIDTFCANLNGESPEKTANVYKYLSENNFYHDFMLDHYLDNIKRGDLN